MNHLVPTQGRNIVDDMLHEGSDVVSLVISNYVLWPKGLLSRIAGLATGHKDITLAHVDDSSAMPTWKLTTTGSKSLDRIAHLLLGLLALAWASLEDHIPASIGLGYTLSYKYPNLRLALEVVHFTMFSLHRILVVACTTFALITLAATVPLRFPESANHPFVPPTLADSDAAKYQQPKPKVLSQQIVRGQSVPTILLDVCQKLGIASAPNKAIPEAIQEAHIIFSNALPPLKALVNKPSEHIFEVNNKTMQGTDVGILLLKDLESVFGIFDRALDKDYFLYQASILGLSEVIGLLFRTLFVDLQSLHLYKAIRPLVKDHRQYDIENLRYLKVDDIGQTLKIAL
ncbi:hypothetical protein H0H93_001928 [Arthromyces matolae]|nr:hypothetical protein H0H93_001928 [Arthromyces matolae]